MVSLLQQLLRCEAPNELAGKIDKCKKGGMHLIYDGINFFHSADIV